MSNSKHSWPLCFYKLFDLLTFIDKTLTVKQINKSNIIEHLILRTTKKPQNLYDPSLVKFENSVP